MIEVFQPTPETTSSEDLETICRVIQETPELGFMYKALILDAIKNNKNRCDLVYARLDGKIAGVAMIGSRRPYPFHFRTGDVAVRKEFRRRRVGTSLYLATTCAGILEGRRTVEETVILDLSPWMIRSTPDKRNCKKGPGFLVSLNYHYVGTFPQWTSGFKTIEPWIKPTIFEFEDWVDRTPLDTKIHLIDTPYAQKNYERCIENYQKHYPELAEKLFDLKHNTIPNRVEVVHP